MPSTAEIDSAAPSVTRAEQRGVSVAICTYNGASRIERVLEALAAQTGDTPYEVLLIDNNSSDGVGAIAQAAWDRFGRTDVEFRIIVETQQGLSFARRRGAQEARFELVIFCDDDNLFCPGYVEESARLMADPRFAAVGGPGIPYFEAPPPSFFFERAGYWACGDRFRSQEAIGAEHVICSDGQPVNLFGAGLVLRRQDILTLFALPDFPILTDRSGAALSGGNDCEICFMLMLSGGMLVYSEKLRFDHIIPEGRLDAKYFHRLVEGGGPARAYWRRLADCHVVDRDGFGSLGFRAVLRAVRNLLTGGDREAVFKLAYWLGLTAPMNETERTAVTMADRARKMPRAKPSQPKPVTLKTTWSPEDPPLPVETPATKSAA